jgi:hypothetical protein
MEKKELKGIESILELRLGTKIRIEQEIESTAGTTYQLGEPFQIKSWNVRNVELAVESGKKFEVVEC